MDKVRKNKRKKPQIGRKIKKKSKVNSPSQDEVASEIHQNVQSSGTSHEEVAADIIPSLEEVVSKTPQNVKELNRKNTFAEYNKSKKGIARSQRAREAKKRAKINYKLTKRGMEITKKA